MSTTTSDTPRTDANHNGFQTLFDGSRVAVVTIDFARELERELAQAKAYSQQVVVNITEEMNGLKAGNARLLRELEELRKDKARLDWLEQQGVINFGWKARRSTTGRGYRLHQDVDAPHRRGPRQAIDAAMEASK